MCYIVNTRFLRPFGVLMEITTKSPQNLYNGSFFGPFLLKSPFFPHWKVFYLKSSKQDFIFGSTVCGRWKKTFFSKIEFGSGWPLPPRFGESPHFLLDLFCETFPHGIRKVTLRANDRRGSLIRNYDLKNSHPSTHPCFHHVVQEVHGSGDKLPRDAKYHQAFSPALVTPGLLKWSFQVRMIMLTRRQGRW